jgi:hypothetical protein
MLVLAVCFCAALFATAQDKPAQNSPAPPVTSITTKPPDVSKEALVWDKLITNVRMNADGTGTRETIARVRILADSGVKEMAVLTFTYTASNQQVEIGYVRVIKPDGSVVITPDYNALDMPADVTRAAPMYSDIHQKHVAVKGLGVGDTLEYQITLRTLKPEVPGQFWLEYSFQKDLIALDEQLDLDLPADKAVTVASADLRPTVTSAGGRKLYHWASSNLARPDPDAPPKSVKRWKPSVQITTFTNWEQVGAWYNSLQRDSLIVTPAIQAKADALTKGLTSNDDKLRAIFNDVALHIHYVGLEFGIGRYQPHPADDVLSNEYGDCKDKHTLLAALLKAAGIEAWPVLISAASRELDPATPSPAQFNHVITLVPLNGKLLWMDSTEEVAPVGLLMDGLRDKQALAIPDGKPAYLEKTPEDSPSPRSIHIEVNGKLSNKGLFTGRIDQSTDGDVGMVFRSGFRQVPQSQWKELLQRIAQAQNCGGEVSNPQVSDVEQIAKPFEFSFDYTREKYYQWDDHVTSHWISPPLPQMGGELPPGVKEKKPADDPDLGSTGETAYHATMELPTGWSMVPPQSSDLKEDWLEYHAKYSFKNGIFTADRVLLVKKTKVPIEQWEKYLAFRRGVFEDWNRQTLISPLGQAIAQNWQRKINEITPLEGARTNESQIVFRFVSDSAVTQPLRDALAILVEATWASTADLAKAVDLSRQGVDAIEAKTLQLSPDDADSLDWTQLLAHAWSARGWAALEVKDLPTAENYLRAAWQLSQDQMIGYQLGRLLEAKGDKAAAMHIFELASVSTAGMNDLVDRLLYSNYKVGDQIAASYQKLAGKPLTATALNHDQYNGSLSAELDKENEIKGFTQAGKLNGVAFFVLAYEPERPVKVYLLQGDKEFASMESTLLAHDFPVSIPNGSKARLLRAVRLICSSYGGGCDAYLLLPSAIHIPPKGITPPNASQGTKVVPIDQTPETQKKIGTVERVRFFESGFDAPPLSERHYATRFDFERTHYINYELDLAHPFLQNAVEFALKSVWYGPDGKQVHESKQKALIRPEWKTSSHCHGYGSSKGGTFIPGTYRVELSVDGKKIAEGSFEVYADSSKSPQQTRDVDSSSIPTR